MFFCDFYEIFKSTFFVEYFWFFRSLPKNDINWGNNDFNANTEHIFVCCDNFEASIQNNLTKYWRFSAEMSVVGFRYSETIVFGLAKIIELLEVVTEKLQDIMIKNRQQKKTTDYFNLWCNINWYITKKITSFSPFQIPIGK